MASKLKEELVPGMRFQQRGGQAFVWEIERFFDAVDGRKYAVLRRTDNPSDKKTLATQGLRDGMLFKHVPGPRLSAPATSTTEAAE